MANFAKGDNYGSGTVDTVDPYVFQRVTYEETAGGSHFDVGWIYIEENAARGGADPMSLLDIYYTSTYYDPPPAHPVDFEVSGYGTVGSDECLVEGFYHWHGGQTHRSYIYYQYQFDNPNARELRGFSDGFRVVSPYNGIQLVDAGSATGTSANPSATTSSLPANCLIVAAIAHAYRNTPTPGSGYSSGISYDSGNWTFLEEYILDTGAAGTKTVDFVCNADNWGFIWMAFQATQSGVAVPVLDKRRRRV